MHRFEFVKMHGIGNDYVYIDAFTDTANAERFLDPRTGADLIRRVSDRHTGIGGDGVILVARPTDPVAAQCRMRMFNADGSESEMCGNGIRCVAKFAHDRLGLTVNPLRVETGRGVLPVEYQLDQSGKLASAIVDMGPPILELPEIPVDQAQLGDRIGEHEHAVTIDNTRHTATFVSMGNPHAVVFVEDASSVELDRVGPIWEHHPAFPLRINTHFVEVRSRDHAVMRTWERGSGATRACGTGACAVLVAGVLTNRLETRATTSLPGGDLTIEWADPSANGSVLMTGPARDSFEGVWVDEGRP